jgi:hypothetical protein
VPRLVGAVRGCGRCAGAWSRHGRGTGQRDALRGRAAPAAWRFHHRGTGRHGDRPGSADRGAVPLRPPAIKPFCDGSHKVVGFRAAGAPAGRRPTAPATEDAPSGTRRPRRGGCVRSARLRRCGAPAGATLGRSCTYGGERCVTGMREVESTVFSTWRPWGRRFVSAAWRCRYLSGRPGVRRDWLALWRVQVGCVVCPSAIRTVDICSRSSDLSTTSWPATS